MSRWLPRILAEIARLAAAQRLSFTHKALRELAALDLGLDPEDARAVLMQLDAGDSAGRRTSTVTGEWLYIFKPLVQTTVVYVKVILRADCVVVSFHADEGADDDHDP